MIDSPATPHKADAEHFVRNGIAADAHNASRAREELTGWLQEFFDLDPIRYSDLVLAVNEALANAAKFAYLAAGRLGTMDIFARHQDSVLTVLVADQGRWRLPDPRMAGPRSGHGIRLMRALSDRARIDHSTEGTQVRLEWDDVFRR